MEYDEFMRNMKTLKEKLISLQSEITPKLTTTGMSDKDLIEVIGKKFTKDELTVMFLLETKEKIKDINQSHQLKSDVAFM